MTIQAQYNFTENARKHNNSNESYKTLECNLALVLNPAKNKTEGVRSVKNICAC